MGLVLFAWFLDVEIGREDGLNKQKKHRRQAPFLLSSNENPRTSPIGKRVMVLAIFLGPFALFSVNERNGPDTHACAWMTHLVWR